MEARTLETNNNNLKFAQSDNKKYNDNKYNDNFEKDIGEDDSSKGLPQKSLESEDDQDVIVSTLTRVAFPIGISQQQVALGNEQILDKPSDTDSEPDTDVYNFSEDQQRAMMELIAQKQEDADLLDEEPPEYNVKGRLEQLNAELANDPMPVEKDREHRVGFKQEIVDLVAPPPDYSDDESQANSFKVELHTSKITDVQKERKDGTHKEEKDSTGQLLNSTHTTVEKEGVGGGGQLHDPTHTTVETESTGSRIREEKDSKGQLHDSTHTTVEKQGSGSSEQLHSPTHTTVEKESKGSSAQLHSPTYTTVEKESKGSSEQLLNSTHTTVEKEGIGNSAQLHSPTHKTVEKQSTASIDKKENYSKEEMHNPTHTTIQNEGKGVSDKEDKTNSKENGADKQQYLVEQDGQFSLLSANELSPAERALYEIKDSREKKVEKQSENEHIKDNTQSNRSLSAGSSVPGNIASSKILPRPPAQPRPQTTASAPRRNINVTQLPQIKSTGQSINLSSTFDNFNYNSPYAMTPEQKEEAREKARRLEEERKEKERIEMREAEERRRENDSAFQAWLCKKMEDDRKRLESEGEKPKTEQERKEENEEVYKSWLLEKKSQLKKEKLLKRRQQQERVEGLVLRSPEECDKAFKHWLKKKNSTSRRQFSLERQTNRMYKLQVQRSRKIQALVNALKESETGGYVDYYGYRF